jgi:hypothetical protein
LRSGDWILSRRTSSDCLSIARHIDKMPVSLLLHRSNRLSAGPRTSPVRFVAMKTMIMKTTTKTTATPKGVMKG